MPLTPGQSEAPPRTRTFYAELVRRGHVDPSLWLTGVVVLALLLVPKLFQQAAGHTGDLDTGNYSNLAWALSHGEGFRGSVLGRHHLGEHFSPIMLLVAPLYLLWQSAYVLMALQATAVAGAIVLALYLADRQLRAAGMDDAPGSGESAGRVRFAAGATLLVMFLFYPPLLATWATQFQPIELGMPLVVAAILLMHARRNAWLTVVVFLLLCTRESSPLAVAGLAIYAAFVLRRWKLAILLGVAAGAWAGVTMGLIMPYFRTEGRWAHVRHVGPGEMWGLKLRYLAVMLLGLGPLPFLGRRAIATTASALPGIALNLAVARETQINFVGHYDAQTAPFLMVAAVHGVVALATWARDAINRRDVALVPKNYLLMLAASLVICFVLFGVANAKGPFQQVVRWYPTSQRRAFVREASRLGKELADAPAMSAWSLIGPQVCHRPNYMALRCGTSEKTWRAWASNRLLPGTILIVPTEHFPEECGERPLVRSTGRATLVYRGKMVEAWRWPDDAPQPGTEGAARYVRTGLSVARSASTQPTP